MDENRLEYIPVGEWRNEVWKQLERLVEDPRIPDKKILCIDKPRDAHLIGGFFPSVIPVGTYVKVVIDEKCEDGKELNYRGLYIWERPVEGKTEIEAYIPYDKVEKAKDFVDYVIGRVFGYLR